MRRVSKIIALLTALVLILTFGGVAATWILADGAAQTQSLELTASMTEFESNSIAVIENILNDLNNADTQNTTGYNFNQRMDRSSGQHSFYGNMDEDYTLDTEDSLELGDWSFLVRTEETDYSSSSITTAEIYLICVDLGENGNPTIPIGEYVYRVYKTDLERADSNSDWTIVQTQLGFARSCWYLDNSTLASQQYTDQIPSIDVNTWTAGILGYSNGTRTDDDYTYDYNNYSMNIAVRTFDGDTPSAYNNSFGVNADNEKTYYTSTQKSSGAFYFFLETTRTTYRFYYYSGGYTYYGTSGRSILARDTTYSWNSTGDYVITWDVAATVSVFTTDEENPIVTVNASSGVYELEFSAGYEQTKYFIKVDSGGETCNLTINHK